MEGAGPGDVGAGSAVAAVCGAGEGATEGVGGSGVVEEGEAEREGGKCIVGSCEEGARMGAGEEGGAGGGE